MGLRKLGEPVPSGIFVVSGISGIPTKFEAENISNTAVLLISTAGGFRNLELRWATGSSAGPTKLHLVFGARNSVEASIFLADARIRKTILKGDLVPMIEFEEGKECTSVYAITDAAETGTSVLYGSYI